MSLSKRFLLRDNVTFLNHGSFGACPKPVFEVYQAWQRKLERQPVEFLDRQFPSLLATARGHLATYVGAQTDDIVFVPNATTAVNIIAQSLDLKPGDEILTTDHEYGALDRAWAKVCGRKGARYIRRRIPLPVQDEQSVVDALWSGRTPHTRVLFLSHITSPTALTIPIKPLVNLARRAGITSIIDGAHAPGQIPLDLSALGADFYTGNAHKWMMAPKGCAFLFARKEVQQLVEPLVVSWGDKSLPDSRFIQELEWQGTRDISAYLSISAAIQFMNDHAWAEVRDRSHQLVRRFRAGMQRITGLAPICPDDKLWNAQMSAAPLATGDGASFQKALYDRYRIEIPVTELGDRRFLRISVQGYNTEEDVDRLLGAVDEIYAEFFTAGA